MSERNAPRISGSRRVIGLTAAVLVAWALVPGTAVAETTDPEPTEAVEAPVPEPAPDVPADPVAPLPDDPPVVSATPAHTATPALTATPNTDLVNGQEIVVAGTGFTANTSVGFAVCSGSSLTQDDCDLANIGYATTDGTGAFSTPFHVRRILHTQNAVVDCASVPDTCRIGAAKLYDYTESANTVINFDPTVPLPPPPNLFLVPSATGLTDGQNIGIFGSGFPASAPVRIEECLVGGGAGGCRQLGNAGADGSGGLLAIVTVRRQINKAFEDPTDCADAIGTCELVLTSLADPDARGIAPLGFDPGGSLPLPTLDVDPDTGLLYREQVTVSGSAYFFNSVQVLQCKAGAMNIGDCRPFPVYSGTGGEDATFSVPFDVRRILHLQSGTFDCAGAPGACDVVVISFPEQVTVRAPLSFDPSAPIPPPPVLTVTPNTGLPYHQVVEVQGTGFPANTALQFAECAGSGLEGCNYGGPSSFVVTDATGAFTAHVPVIRSLRTYATDPPSIVDCSSAPGTCELRASSYDDEDAAASAALTFDPAALIPTPTIEVVPNTGLADRQMVALHAEGFLPGDFVGIAQCESGSSIYGTGCSISGTRFVFADETGSIDMLLRVHRTIEYYDPGAGGSGIEEEDCAESAGACVLHVESQLDPNGVSDTPLDFDTDAPATPPPTMTIQPGSTLTDGQQITIDASGFLPDTQLAAVQCAGPLGEGSGSTCGAFTGSLYVTSDENGEVHLTTIAHQVFTPALGGQPIDCGFEPDNCRLVLAEVTGSTSSDATGTVSVTFLAPVEVGGEVVAVEPEPSDTGTSAALAFTGSAPQPMALVGSTAVGVGLLLLLATRRKRVRPL